VLPVQLTLLLFVTGNFYIMAEIRSELAKNLPLIASGKVRELYEVDAKTLLFVASDRISAYDVIMVNVSTDSSLACFIS
jgi:phosphoribosylaminoimidazole-succinocarboxamide synthase